MSGGTSIAAYPSVSVSATAVYAYPALWRTDAADSIAAVAANARRPSIAGAADSPFSLVAEGADSPLPLVAEPIS